MRQSECKALRTECQAIFFKFQKFITSIIGSLEMVGFLHNFHPIHSPFSSTRRSLMRGLLISNASWKTQSISVN